MTIKFKKLSDKAVQPVRATNSGAGYNLTAIGVSTEVNERGQLILVYHTGLSVEIPDGYEGTLRPAASIPSKTLRMIGAPCSIKGTIDDEIVARFIATTDVIPAVYKEDEQIAQLVINKVEDAEFVEFIDTTENNESSATEDEQGLPENEDESINPDQTDTVSGDAENSVEEA